MPVVDSLTHVQDEYAVWTNYPNVHFEYIVAHD